MNNPECLAPDWCQIDLLLPYIQVMTGTALHICQPHLDYYNYLKNNDPLEKAMQKEVLRVREEMRNEN